MTRAKANARLANELLEMARDMHASGVMDTPAYEKITMRHLGEAAKTSRTEPLAPEGIRALRKRAHMSQAVFARHLNLTVGYVSQLERGAKRASGPALVLLDVIRRKGIEAILK